MIVYDALRSAVVDPGAPLGDAAAGSPPLVFYGIRNATVLRASRQGLDVVLEFHY